MNPPFPGRSGLGVERDPLFLRPARRVGPVKAPRFGRLGRQGACLAWEERGLRHAMALPSDNETLFSPFHGRGTPLSFLGDVTRDPVADVTRSKREALALLCPAMPCHAFGKAWQGKTWQGMTKHGKAWQSKTRAFVPGRVKNILFESCRVETPSLIQWIEDQCSISWRTDRRLIRCFMK